MKGINSISDLETLRESIQQQRDSAKMLIRICNTGCRARKSAKVIDALEDEIEKKGLGNKVTIKKTGCHGFCEMGTIMVIEPGNIFYCRVTPGDVVDILSKTLVQGNVVERLLWRDPETKELVICEKDIPFYKKQKKHISYNSGKIDPTDIEDYIAADGYSALCKALSALTPSEIVETVVASGLRGRGGGGVSNRS